MEGMSRTDGWRSGENPDGMETEGWKEKGWEQVKSGLHPLELPTALPGNKDALRTAHLAHRCPHPDPRNRNTSWVLCLHTHLGEKQFLT